MTEVLAPATSAVKSPQSALELSYGEFRGQLALLQRSKLFWLGCALKLGFSLCFGSHFATRWFAPFVYTFTHSHFQNPWTEFLARGEPMAFPYGPAMLGILSVPFAPAWFFAFDPSSHLGLLLLRLPLFVADLSICILLMRWQKLYARDVIVGYWVSPIVLYATYMHGQLDLIPTALLCASLFLMFENRAVWSGLVFGLALATKLHLLIALPFAVVFLFRQRKRPYAWLTFSASVFGVSALLFGPVLPSSAFRSMVFGSHEAEKLWAVAIPYGFNGLVLHIAPAAVLIAFLRFASYRKVNREITLMFIGALYVVLVALVPPQPGWFIWSLPFATYLGARYSRAGRFVLPILSVAYCVYFFIGGPEVFMEALDPTFGQGFGARSAQALGELFPLLFGQRAASIAWTFLFSATSLAGVEMYRKGVRSNSVYRFREQSFMIGIGGDSGAGKHTLADDLAAVLGPQISLINGDDDHRWERGHAMWRRYTHLDPRGNLLEAQLSALTQLQQGGNVRKRQYDHQEGRFTGPLVIAPNDFVAIVGLHPFYLGSQRELFELKIFVDPEEDLRRKWKVERDTQTRGYTREQVIEQIEKRMADSLKYVRPQMKHADVVIRQRVTAEDAPDTVDLEVELTSALDALSLLDAFDALGGLEVVWTPDEELARDRISVRGRVSGQRVGVLTRLLLPNVEELVLEDAWPTGGRGLAVAAVLHAISVRLRSHSREVGPP